MAVGDAYRNADCLSFTAEVSGSQVPEPLICEVEHTRDTVRLDVYGTSHTPLYSFRSFVEKGEVYVEERNFRTGESRNEVVSLPVFQDFNGWDIECIDELDFCSFGMYWRTWVGPQSSVADDYERYLARESQNFGLRQTEGGGDVLYLWQHPRGYFEEWIWVDEPTHLIVERLRPDPTGDVELKHRVFRYDKRKKGDLRSPTDPDFGLATFTRSERSVSTERR